MKKSKGNKVSPQANGRANGASAKSKSPGRSDAQPLTATPGSVQSSSPTKTPPMPVRLTDECFSSHSIIYHYDVTGGPNWHHCKDIKTFFVSRQGKRVLSVMYPISREDLGMDRASFQNAAVVTFSSDKDIPHLLRKLKTLNKKAEAFPQRKSLPVCSVRIEADGKPKPSPSELKAILPKLKEGIEEAHCGTVTQEFTNGVVLEVYKFQQNSLQCLLKATRFHITEVLDVEREGDEERDASAGAASADASGPSETSTEAGSDVDDGKPSSGKKGILKPGAKVPSSSGKTDTPKAAADGDTSSSVQKIPSKADAGGDTSSSVQKIPSKADAGGDTSSSVQKIPSKADAGGDTSSSVQKIPSKADAGGDTSSSVQKIPSKAGAGADTSPKGKKDSQKTAAADTSSSRKDDNPTASGEHKKAVLANTNEQLRGKEAAGHTTLGKTSPSVSPIPPSAKPASLGITTTITDSERPGSGAASSADSYEAIGAEDGTKPKLRKTSTDPAKHKGDKRKALEGANGKAMKFNENDKGNKNSGALDTAFEQRLEKRGAGPSKEDTSPRKEKTQPGKEDTSKSKVIWKKSSSGWSLELDQYTCKYIQEFHKQDLETRLGVKVHISAKDIAISKGSGDARQVNRAKEEIPKVIDSLTIDNLRYWTSKPTELEDMEQRYDKDAYMDWDTAMNSLVLVTKTVDFARIKEELENWDRDSEKAAKSAKDDTPTKGVHPATLSTHTVTMHVGGTERAKDMPRKLDALPNGTRTPRTDPVTSGPLPPIPPNEEKKPARPEDDVFPAPTTEPITDGSESEEDIWADPRTLRRATESSPKEMSERASHKAAADPQSASPGNKESSMTTGTSKKTKRPAPNIPPDSRARKSSPAPEPTPSPRPLPEPDVPKSRSKDMAKKPTSKDPADPRSSGSGSKKSSTPPRPSQPPSRPPSRPPSQPPPVPSRSPPPPPARAPPSLSPKSTKEESATTGRGAGSRPGGQRRRLANPDPMSFSSRKSALTVHVLVHDITRLRVDAIVNAANRRLQHGGGVAWAIAKAAGRSLTQDCDSYIRHKGKLRVTENMVSVAGKLPCEKVIHAVGPAMDHYNNANECYRDVFRTLSKVVDTATQQFFRSIAIPAISSGIFGVPPEKVAESMVSVVCDLAAKQTSLQDVYLVDITPDVITYIQQDLQRREDVFVAGPFLGLPGEDAPRDTDTSPSPSPTPSPDDYLADPPPGYDPKSDCSICMDTAEDPKTIRQCGHVFCRDCIHQAFSHKPVCPVCGVVVGKVVGDQPDNGEMYDHNEMDPLGGYPGCGTIVIRYHFPDGIQQDNHPHPGHRFKGTSREAYLPNNPEGQKVLKLLKRAFKQRLVFTVGQSRTTGKGDTVTWNDIHHKTNRHGGPQRFGYPDPTYLSRVQEELAAKGVK